MANTNYHLLPMDWLLQTTWSCVLSQKSHIDEYPCEIGAQNLKKSVMQELPASKLLKQKLQSSHKKQKKKKNKKEEK